MSRSYRFVGLVERMSDTEAALGNDIMKVALYTYRQLKMTGQAEGMEAHRKELSVLFAKAPRQRPEAAAA